MRLTVHPRTTYNSGIAAALGHGPLGTFGRKAPLRTERFNSIVARMPSVSHRFLAPSPLRLLYSLVVPALLPLHRACFHPASNRREDFRGPLILEPAHGADLG